MKIVWYSFIHSWVWSFYTRLSCIGNMLNTDKYGDKWNMNLWMNVMWNLHLPINLCVKCVFNGQYQCVKHMIYEWTNFAWFLLLSREMLSLWWKNRKQLIWHHVHFIIYLFRNCVHVFMYVTLLISRMLGSI
jgi:hypothetical protein